MQTYWTRREFPCGALRLIASDSALLGVDNSHAELPGGVCEMNDVLRETTRQLFEYFAGSRHDFDLPLDARGTAFQQSIWQAMRTIPFGSVWSYGQLAAAAGNPDAVRAVGGACGRNPIMIVIPCHRVLSAAGKLTGFGGGIALKQWLLAHEGITLRTLSE